MRIILSAVCAISSLCVIMTIVWEKRSLVIFKSPITSRLVLLSRQAVHLFGKTERFYDIVNMLFVDFIAVKLNRQYNIFIYV